MQPTAPCFAAWPHELHLRCFAAERLPFFLGCFFFFFFMARPSSIAVVVRFSAGDFFAQVAPHTAAGSAAAPPAATSSAHRRNHSRGGRPGMSRELPPGRELVGELARGDGRNVALGAPLGVLA